MDDMGIKDINVRFFISDFAGAFGLREVEEEEFFEREGSITYERHTIHENGCRQICLTKFDD